MRLTAALRRALRLLDAAPTALRRAFAPATGADLLRGPFAPDAAVHPIPTLLVALDGPARLAFRRERCDLAPGDAVVVPAATWHVYPSGRRRGLLLGVGWLGDRADLWLDGPGLDMWAAMPLEPVRRRLRAAAAADAATRLAAVRSLLEAVAAEDLDGLREVPPAVYRMLGVLLRRLHEGATVADLVRASGLGRAQAYARFAAFAGMSPGRALELRRLELARALLRSGCGVADVAAACGWHRRETFSRAWSRAYGAPPRSERPRSA